MLCRHVCLEKIYMTYHQADKYTEKRITWYCSTYTCTSLHSGIHRAFIINIWSIFKWIYEGWLLDYISDIKSKSTAKRSTTSRVCLLFLYIFVYFFQQIYWVYILYVKFFLLIKNKLDLTCFYFLLTPNIFFKDISCLKCYGFRIFPHTQPWGLHVRGLVSH